MICVCCVTGGLLYWQRYCRGVEVPPYGRESPGQRFSAVCFFWRDSNGPSWHDASGTWLMSLNTGLYNPVSQIVDFLFSLSSVPQSHLVPCSDLLERANWGPKRKGLAQSPTVVEVAELRPTSGFFPPRELCYHFPKAFSIESHIFRMGSIFQLLWVIVSAV